jgi:hypothetical protein
MIASWIDGNGHEPEDVNLLTDIRDLFETADPMPMDLPERIRLSLALRALEAEVASYGDASDELVLAARGQEESRTVTFDSDSLTIMIRIDSNPDGTARVDGWLAPPHPHDVEMRMTGDSIMVTADQLGRFVFFSVPRGTARLIVHQASEGVSETGRDSSSGPVKSVVTPALTLLADE